MTSRTRPNILASAARDVEARIRENAKAQQLELPLWPVPFIVPEVAPAATEVEFDDLCPEHFEDK